MIRSNIVIIGAGVVGLAIAAELSKKFKDVLVIDRWPHPGEEVSSRNSEVIHAGIYYPENTLKSKLCVLGNRSLYNYANKYKIPFRNIGKFIVGSKNDHDSLIALKKNAEKNGVDLELVDSEYLNRTEPSVISELALWSKTSGIIDSWTLIKTLEAEAIENKCDIAYGHEVIAIERKDDWIITLRSQNDEIKVSSNILINSAGLDSDRIAEMAGVEINKRDLELTYARGHYFKLSPKFNNYISKLIYPIPRPNTSSLGIHLTLDLNGGVRIGPDIEFMDTKVQEFPIPLNLRTKFYKAAKSYLKNINEEDLFPDYSGIRPKLQRQGEPQRDFYIELESKHQGLIDLIGIESPGLTACLEIAKYVSHLADYC